MRSVGLSNWTEFLIADKTLEPKRRVASKYINSRFAIRDESIFTTAH